MISKYFHYIGIFSCLALIITCFLPWTHYNNINETFTGFHVTRFPTGNYYGRAGLTITVVTSIILLLILTPRLWAKRVNLFLSALLLAYCVRTYIIFTSALFDGEVDKLAGIYLIVVFAVLLMASAVFPYTKKKY